jgi:hypothetical protein
VISLRHGFETCMEDNLLMLVVNNNTFPNVSVCFSITSLCKIQPPVTYQLKGLNLYLASVDLLDVVQGLSSPCNM